jgi:hypothetical protein
MPERQKAIVHDRKTPGITESMIGALIDMARRRDFPARRMSCPLSVQAYDWEAIRLEGWPA